MASAPQRTISQRAVMVESPVLWSGPGNRVARPPLRRARLVAQSPRPKVARTLPKTARRRNARKCPELLDSQAAGGKRAGARQRANAPASTSPVERRTHLRQRVHARCRLLSQAHLLNVPLHLQAGEPFDIAREIDVGPHAADLVHGSIGRQVLDDLVAGLLLGIEAPLDVLVARASAQQADHHAGGRLAGRLDVDDGDLPASLAFERSDALARLCRVRTGREILKIQVE